MTATKWDLIDLFVIFMVALSVQNLFLKYCIHINPYKFLTVKFRNVEILHVCIIIILTEPIGKILPCIVKSFMILQIISIVIMWVSKSVVQMSLLVFVTKCICMLLLLVKSANRNEMCKYVQHLVRNKVSFYSNSDSLLLDSTSLSIALAIWLLINKWYFFIYSS